MFHGLHRSFVQQICNGGVEQARHRVYYGERGKDVARLVARHGQGVDLEVLGELLLCQANGPTASPLVRPKRLASDRCMGSAMRCGPCK